MFRYYFLWFVLVLVHWYLFFALVSDTKVCKKVKYCNKVRTNTSLTIIYVLFCLYFVLCASQIKEGLPELRKGGFLLGQYNRVSMNVFKGWYNLPFFFELRTIIDWTFTQTSLDMFESIKLSQIQADMYLSKCKNKHAMHRELGLKQPLIKKIGIGFSFLMVVLILISGPMLLFSTLNPVATPNPVLGGFL